MSGLKFPKGFLWGTATSAYQVEGNNNRADWWRWEKEREFKKLSGRAADHYRRYEEDFDLAKKLGTNAHRFSVEWSRVEAEEGKFDESAIRHYQKVVASLVRRKIEPMVTLWHFTLPQWLAEKGGWLNPKAVFYFSRYASKMVKALGPQVRLWITLNEPLVYLGYSYFEGAWPPGERNFIKAIRVFSKLVLAHRKAYEVINRGRKGAKVGIAKHNTWFMPAGNPFQKILRAASQWLWNDLFLLKIKNQLDFVGLNYYSGRETKIFSLSNPSTYESSQYSDAGMKICPQGIYYVLKKLKRYNLPIYITENGLADAKDSRRKKFIGDHLFWLARAIEEGIPVKGYFHWSLLDNYEWDKGFGQRYGLVKINYSNQKRIPRQSFYFYQKICRSNKIFLK